MLNTQLVVVWLFSFVGGALIQFIRMWARKFRGGSSSSDTIKYPYIFWIGLITSTLGVYLLTEFAPAANLTGAGATVKINLSGIQPILVFNIAIMVGYFYKAIEAIGTYYFNRINKIPWENWIEIIPFSISALWVISTMLHGKYWVAGKWGNYVLGFSIFSLTVRSAIYIVSSNLKRRKNDGK